MTDPFSILTGTVGVLAPTLHGIRLLLDDLQKIKDAPDSIKALEDDIQSVNTVLKSLNAVGIENLESLGGTVAEDVKTTVTACAAACHIFKTNLKRWVSHSQDGKLSLQARAKVGFFKHSHIKSISEQLQNFKITINLVISVANLHSSFHNSHITEETAKIISSKRDEVASTIQTTDEQLVKVERRLQDLTVVGATQEDIETLEDMGDAARQTDEEVKALRASQKLLIELLMRVQEDSIGKSAAENQPHSAQVTFGNGNSGLQIGVSSGAISGIHFGAK